MDWNGDLHGGLVAMASITRFEPPDEQRISLLKFEIQIEEICK